MLFFCPCSQAITDGGWREEKKLQRSRRARGFDSSFACHGGGEGEERLGPLSVRENPSVNDGRQKFMVWFQENARHMKMSTKVSNKDSASYSRAPTPSEEENESKRISFNARWR